MSEDRAQVRIDDTRNRLTLLRRATLGLETPAYGGQMRLSGYVADNGQLPGSIQDLLTPNGHAEQGLVSPKFSFATDSSCTQTGGDTATLSESPLVKGHRGNYLASVAHGGEFRDGWGNEAALEPECLNVDKNFGWCVTSNASAMTITSLGADNMKDDSSSSSASANAAAETDQSMTISKTDWLVEPAALQIQIRNASSGNADFSNLGAALLVYKNDGTNEGKGQWLQLQWHGSPSSGCYDVMDNGDACWVTFASACSASIPLGRHVLALTRTTDTDGEGTKKRLPLVFPGTQTAITTTVDFYPGVTPPDIVWDIRDDPASLSTKDKDSSGGGSG
jgi:hypothetical protein